MGVGTVGDVAARPHLSVGPPRPEHHATRLPRPPRGHRARGGARGIHPGRAHHAVLPRHRRVPLDRVAHQHLVRPGRLPADPAHSRRAGTAGRSGDPRTPGEGQPRGSGPATTDVPRPLDRGDGGSGGDGHRRVRQGDRSEPTPPRPRHRTATPRRSPGPRTPDRPGRRHPPGADAGTGAHAAHRRHDQPHRRRPRRDRRRSRRRHRRATRLRPRTARSSCWPTSRSR